MEQTSLQAWYMVSKDLNRRESLVFDVLKQLGGQATAWEILDTLRIRNPNVVRPRLTGLYKKGIIVKTGTSYNSKYKCTEIVWMIKEKQNGKGMGR